jgi:hypothetical protein
LEVDMNTKRALQELATVGVAAWALGCQGQSNESSECGCQQTRAAQAGAAGSAGRSGGGAPTAGGAAGASVSEASPAGSFPGPAGDVGSTAIALDDERIVGWAAAWLDPVAYGQDVDEEWQAPDLALGAATGDSYDVVSLGNGGSITLTFDNLIRDGSGFDFAVFENGHLDTFLELAFVEVSSDGTTFARFESTYLGTEPVSQYGAHDPTLMDGLAGKYRVGFGTPFDLAALDAHPLVRSGAVDLRAIAQVRILDIIGDGREQDSHGNPIYDPYPTVGSGGFDLEAVAVLNAADD